MGSATDVARSAVGAALNAASDVDLTTADELFAAARTLAGTPQLAASISDRGAVEAARTTVVARVFEGWSPAARAVLDTAARQTWSTTVDLVDAVEEAGIRAAVRARPDAAVDRELFQVGHLVAGDADLELALGSRLGRPSEKGRLVRSILEGRVSDATVLIVASVVQRSRERRVRELLTRAQDIAADQRNRVVATVTTAVPMAAGQRTQLETWLSAKYGRPVTANLLLDPSLLGGLRVRVADDVIDATVATRLADLRQRLVG